MRINRAYPFDLASDGACNAPSVAGRPVSSYLTFSPLPLGLSPNVGRNARMWLWGGSFSVALSLKLPSPAVNRHPAL